MPSAICEYVPRPHAPKNSRAISGEEWSGNWLGSAASRHAPQRVLYIGRFLNPAFVSTGYTSYVRTKTWTPIEIIYLDEIAREPREYPNITLRGETIDALDSLANESYEAICCDNVFLYLDRVARENLANRLRSIVARGGNIYIADQHVIRADGHSIPNDWLSDRSYFSRPIHAVSPNDVLTALNVGLEPSALAVLKHVPSIHLAERFSGQNTPTALKNLCRCFYSITVQME